MLYKIHFPLPIDVLDVDFQVLQRSDLVSSLPTHGCCI